MQVIGVCLCVFVCKSLLTTLDHKIITVIFDFIIYSIYTIYIYNIYMRQPTFCELIAY